MAQPNKKYAQEVETPTQVIKDALLEFFHNDLKASTEPFKLDQFKKAKTVEILKKSGAVEPSKFDIGTLNRRMTNRFKTFIKEGVITRIENGNRRGWYAFSDTKLEVSESLKSAKEPVPTKSNGSLLQRKVDGPLNTILYGPPGTGKTFSTKQKAIEIIESKDLGALEDKSYINNQYKKYLEAGQIEFVTFHQSYGYEDFVEGIKPKAISGNVTYAVEDGILKRISRASLKEVEPAGSEKSILTNVKGMIKSNADVWKIKPTGDYSEYEELCFKTGSIGFQDYLDIDFTGGFTNDRFDSIYQLKRGKPKSKTGNYGLLRIFAHERIENEIILLTADNKNISAIGVIKGSYWYDSLRFPDAPHRRSVDWLLKDTKIPFSVFHYKGKNGHFNGVDSRSIDLESLQGYIDSLSENVTARKNHVLIIDEINRGNVAAIFGEAITLLEDSKRIDEPDEIQVTLPYSKKKFGLPKNLYIIGTMNSVDRSAESLDLALRRRFEFEELLPKPDLLPEEVEGVKVREMLTAINARIEVLVDKHHTIGHAYFMDCKSAEAVMRVFCFKVLPLLEEIFLDNPKQILEVLANKPDFKETFDDKYIRKQPESKKTKEERVVSGPALFRSKQNVEDVKKLLNSIVDG